MRYVCFPLSLRNVEDLLFERALDICHETVRSWVAQIWSDVRDGHSKSTREPAARLPLRTLL